MVVYSEECVVDLVWPGEVEGAEGTRVLRFARRVLSFALVRGWLTGILVRRQLTEILVRTGIFVCRRMAGVLSERGPAWRLGGSEGDDEGGDCWGCPVVPSEQEFLRR